MSGRCLWLLLCVFGVSLVTCEIACRNEDGDPVDWFVIYKLPVRLINRTGGTGVDYLYLDSKSQGWQVSKFLINMTQSAMAQVLQQLYQSYNRNDTAYMLYNDSPPGMNSSVTKRGHTKGALLFDKYQGFWLVHTVPHFPPFPEDGFGYPHTGRRYGQVALCVTYKYNQFKQIDLWGLYRICRGLSFPWIEATRLALLESAQGESFLNFAKSKFFQDDILTAWMAQKLQTDLLTETWQPKGTEVLSNCTLPWHVYTIKRIKFLNYSFYSRHDHSKWCVSRGSQDMWTCIGDLNRYPEQIWRSGGFVCTQNKLIYTAFRNIVAYYSDCG
ncbi:deoxyribonuclease-2-beta isoform X2 [Bufo bufo]|uniref:deoxyribonuclease-2-beta isoform X2 n=1 Tax=Bufo bufo TaxID=8384 RepID=UPI001ABEB0DA|nr:deoxyribonuclease-2-beta isoform X2 [Bufo bufo]